MLRQIEIGSPPNLDRCATTPFNEPAPGSPTAPASLEAPTISAIIPAYNAAKTLGDCLAALATMTRRIGEIIVFCDGATDETEAIARTAGVNVIVHTGPPRGPAYGRNVAAAAASSDLLFFVDADVVVAPDALEKLVAAMEEHQAQAAFGSYDDDPLSRRAASHYANLRHHWVHQRGAREAATFWAGLGLFDRRAFLELGGYDVARFPHPSIEDIELGTRLAARGGRVRLVPDAQGKHCKDWTLLQVWRTDIFRRAAPWSALLVDSKTMRADLNLSVAERAKALIVVATALSLLASVAAPPLLAITAALLVAYVVLNVSFFRLLARRARLPVLAQGMLMHWCYHLYAPATYSVVFLMTRLGLRRSSSWQFATVGRSSQ